MTVTETNFCNKMTKHVKEALTTYGDLKDFQLKAYIYELFELENVELKPFYNNIVEMQDYIFRKVRGLD